CLDLCVRSGNDDDLIVPGLVDDDERDAGGGIHLAHVQLEASQVGERFGPGGVAADTADEANVRAEPRRSDGLVRALAAGDPLEGRRGESLAGSRKPLDTRDEIEIDGADNRELNRHGAIVSVTSFFRD